MPHVVHDIQLAQWCSLYVRFALDNGQRLAAVVRDSPAAKIQDYLLSPEKAGILPLLNQSSLTDEDCLMAYAFLKATEDHFRQKPHPSFLNGFIEKSVDGTRYMLTQLGESPIAKAIPATQRFKHDIELGSKAVLGLRYHWQKIGHCDELEMRRSDSFDVFGVGHKRIKIGFSPLARMDDMLWAHDPQDIRGDGCVPFWCDGAKDEAALLQRLVQVLQSARAQQVHLLLFPELVMTGRLQQALSAWLLEHNAFDPVIRLVVAGTRHVFDSHAHHAYSNRCSVFNHCGDIEWEQEKRQPFELTVQEARDSGHFPGVQSPVSEPTKLSQRLVMRHTALGCIATPICLDFLCDGAWKNMPVDAFLVPAMSPNLTRFQDNCRNVGVARGASAFICNAQPDYEQKALLAYRPAKDPLTAEKQTPFLFTVEVDIDMN